MISRRPLHYLSMHPPPGQTEDTNSLASAALVKRAPRAALPRAGATLIPWGPVVMQCKDGIWGLLTGLKSRAPK